MTGPAKPILDAFDALPPDEALVMAAAELFLELDSAEGDDSESQPRG